MGRKKVVLQDAAQDMLQNMGQQIRLARLRRKVPVEEVASIAGVSRATVWAVEKGMESVAIGNYAAVIAALGLPEDLNLIAREDELGHRLMDERLPLNIRSKPTKKTKGTKSHKRSGK